MSLWDPIKKEQCNLLMASVGPVYWHNGKVTLIKDAPHANLYSGKSLLKAGLRWTPFSDITPRIVGGLAPLSPLDATGIDGLYIPHNGAPPVLRTSEGYLVNLGDPTMPVTPSSPLNMTLDMTTKLFLEYEVTWGCAFIESMRALNTVRVTGGGQLLEEYPFVIDHGYSPDGGIDVLTDGLGVELQKPFDDMMKLTAEQRGLSGIGEHIVFSLAKKGSLVGIIVWDPFKAPVLLGYIPTKQFSAHILVSAPLIPPDSLRSVSRGRSR